MRIIVLHRSYGCDSGCCGHAVVVDEKEGSFNFVHPYGRDPLEFAKKLVEDEMGAEHIKDLDWEHCIIDDDN